MCSTAVLWSRTIHSIQGDGAGMEIHSLQSLGLWDHVCSSSLRSYFAERILISDVFYLVELPKKYNEDIKLIPLLV